jgi:hypothetical protein
VNFFLVPIGIPLTTLMSFLERWFLMSFITIQRYRFSLTLQNKSRSVINIFLWINPPVVFLPNFEPTCGISAYFESDLWYFCPTLNPPVVFLPNFELTCGISAYFESDLWYFCPMWSKNSLKFTKIFTKYFFLFRKFIFGIFFVRIHN